MRTRTLLPLTGLLVIGCSATPAAPVTWSFASGTPPPTVAAAAAVVEVYKSPSCSCCHEWEAYLRALGYTVRSIPTDDLTSIKAQHAVPQEAWSCHTAIVGGYVVEGHVPVEAIEDLLERRPDIDGIALPAMPAGSPGMPGVKGQPFEILALNGGSVSAFGSY